MAGRIGVHDMMCPSVPPANDDVPLCSDLSLRRACLARRSGVQDVFDMLQSPTFVMQLGYGILEILVVNTFPELKTLFRGLEQGDF